MLIKKRFSNKKVKALAGIMTACLIFGGTLFALPIQNARGNDDSYPPNDDNYEKVWWDEFNDTSLNREKWDYYVGGWNASEVQNCYKDSPENVNVSGGSLNLVGLYKPGLTCNQGRNGDFTSGFVHTKDKKAWTYGYFEARIKMPTNKSTWPAFWMSPQEAKYGGWPKSGEIDIVETKGSNLNYAASDAHWGISAVNKSHSQRVIGTDKFSDTSQWHTYGVKWTEGKLEFYIDGNRYHEIKNFSQPNSTNHPGPFNIPFYLRLNLAIGGSYIDAPWKDAHNSIADFPATMSIDYVRVYQRKPRQPKNVNVPDSNLRTLLNQKLAAQLGTTRTNDQVITDVELESLTNLNLDAAPNAPLDQRISNLTGLEAAKNLTALSLQNNAISDLRPLTGLAALTSLNLNDQLIASSTNTDSFVSPLRDPAGNTVDINNSAEVANDTANPGNIKLLSPIRDGNPHLIVANWSRNVTIGTASAVFSGKLNITATLQAAPTPQPNPSTPSNTQKPGKTQNSNNSLASTGFNILLGVVTALLIGIAGMFILR